MLRLGQYQRVRAQLLDNSYCIFRRQSGNLYELEIFYLFNVSIDGDWGGGEMYKVGIDCHKLQRGKGKSIGIYNYAKILIDQLSKVEGRGYAITVFGNDSNKVDMDVHGVEFIKFDLKNTMSKLRELFWELFYVKRVRRRHQIDLMIYPRGFLPIGDGFGDMVIVHDLIPLYYAENYPGYFNKIEEMYVCQRLRASIKNAQFVTTISKFSMGQIQRLAPLKGALNYIYNGYECSGAGGRDFEEGCARIRNSNPEYIFTVTSNLPHKNANGVLDCFKLYSELDGQLHLKVVGIPNPEDFTEGLPKNLLARVEFLPYLSDSLLLQYMKAATYFLFLSEIEGFGYPPIEAMSLGTVVISSKGGALAEIIGDGGVLVDSSDQAAKAIFNLEQDAALREAYRVKARKNIEKFSLSRFRLGMHQQIVDALKK